MLWGLAPNDSLKRTAAIRCGVRSHSSWRRPLSSSVRPKFVRSIGTLVRIVGIAVFATSATAANLVINSDFATDTNGWANVSGTPLSWDGGTGDPIAGSGHFLTSLSVFAYVTQCIAVSAPQNVDFYANVRATASGSGPFGPREGVDAYSDTTCTNAIGSIAAMTQPLPDDIWHTVSALDLPLPSGTNSVLLTLSASSHGASGIDIHFDHILFGPSGTAPVRLQSFDVE
jgi:hypothetical protein